MLVTKSQSYVFIACVSFGCAVGVLFSIFAIIKFFIKSRTIKSVFDIACFCIVSMLYVSYSFKVGFPEFRGYMTVGVLLGIFCYLKSFHILLAKTFKIFYNIIKERKEKLKKAKDDRIKIQKSNSCVNYRGGAACGSASNGDDLSASCNRRGK